MTIKTCYELRYKATIQGDVLNAPLIEYCTVTIKVDDFETVLEVARDLIKVVSSKTRYTAEIISLTPTHARLYRGDEE